MAKRRFSRKRSYPRRYFRRFRRAKNKVPFETLIAGAAIPFMPPRDGFSSPFEALQRGDMTGVADALKNGFLGMDGGRGTPDINVAGLLNPFDMNYGRYTKMLILAGLIGMTRRRIAGRYTSPLIKKIPVVGRWCS